VHRLSGAGIEQVAIPFRQGLGPIRQAKGRSGGAVGMGSLQRAQQFEALAPLQFVAHGLGDEATAVALDPVDVDPKN
jgi:hypothetical protein